MTALIFGVGLGLFVIVSLWISAVLIFFVSLRIERRVGVLAVLSALVVTVVLVIIPRSAEQDTVFESKLYDPFFIWRLIVLILLALSTSVALYGYIKFNLLESVRPLRIKSWIH